MIPLRVFVCDDESIAVSRLSSLLARIGGVDVVGTALDGAEAVRAVTGTPTDLLLVDIEMPGLDGFDVVEQLAATRPEGGTTALIAFVTAHRRFAPEAFESGAIDFICKPARQGRLERTIARARDAVAAREATRRLADLQGMLVELRSKHDPWRGAHVWISRRGEVVRVDLEQVDWIAAEGPYVRLHVENASYLHREAIGSIEKRLDPQRFARVHRSHLVRIGHIASVRRTMHGGGELILRTGDRVPIGRSYSKEARRSILKHGSPGRGHAQPSTESGPPEVQSPGARR